MTVSFGAAGAGTNSTVTINVAYPTGIVAGHYLTLTVFSGDPADNTVATPAGWTPLASEQNTDGSFATADAGPRRATAFGRVADGTESGTVAVSVAGGTGSLIVGRIDRWTKTLAVWNVVGYSAHYELANGTQTTLVFTGVDLAAGDMLRIGTASPDDTAAVSGQAFSASGFTFNAFAEQSDTGTTAGNDLRGMTGQATVATGTQATVNVTYTATQDESCGGFLIRFRDQAAASETTAPPSPAVATGQASQAAVTVAAAAGTSMGSGAAPAATATVRPGPANATGTGTATAVTSAITVHPVPATGAALAGPAGLVVSPAATPAAGTGAVPSATITIEASAGGSAGQAAASPADVFTASPVVAGPGSGAGAATPPLPVVIVNTSPAIASCLAGPVAGGDLARFAGATFTPNTATPTTGFDAATEPVAAFTPSTLAPAVEFGGDIEPVAAFSSGAGREVTFGHG